MGVKLGGRRGGSSLNGLGRIDLWKVLGEED